MAGPPLLTEIRGTIAVRVEGCAQVVEPRLRQSLWRLTEDRHSPSHGRAGTGPCCTHSPVVDRDLQAQFIHEELHDIIAFPMKFQSSPVVLRGPLKMRKADKSDLLSSASPAGCSPLQEHGPAQGSQETLMRHISLARMRMR